MNLCHPQIPQKVFGVGFFTPSLFFTPSFRQNPLFFFSGFESPPKPPPFWKHSAPVKQSIVTLDMEGVLTPEIWIAVAEKTGIPELRRTTRDEPDYDKLMRGRIEILDQHGLKLSDIQQVIGTLRPLPGRKGISR